MRSITRYIDEYDIAAEIRLERQSHIGSFLLLEGDTDIMRLDSVLSAKFCSVVNCFGRKRAIGAIDLLSQDGFTGAIALIDADFDRILGRLRDHPGLIYSKGHDLDLDWFEDEELDRYLRLMGEKSKVVAARSNGNIRDKIMNSLKGLSLLKLANMSLRCGVKFSSVNIERFYDAYKFDLEAYLDEILTQNPQKLHHRPALLDFVAREIDKNYDLDQLTSGHDLHAALGVLLQAELGSRTPSQTWAREVAKHFYLLCDKACIMSKHAISLLREWEIMEGYTVFDVT